jgi:hypothetical protein
VRCGSHQRSRMLSRSSLGRPDVIDDQMRRLLSERLASTKSRLHVTDIRGRRSLLDSVRASSSAPGSQPRWNGAASPGPGTTRVLARDAVAAVLARQHEQVAHAAALLHDAFPAFCCFQPWARSAGGCRRPSPPPGTVLRAGGGPSHGRTWCRAAGCP